MNVNRPGGAKRTAGRVRVYRGVRLISIAPYPSSCVIYIHPTLKAILLTTSWRVDTSGSCPYHPRLPRTHCLSVQVFHIQYYYIHGVEHSFPLMVRNRSSQQVLGLKVDTSVDLSCSSSSLRDSLIFNYVICTT